ncbi:MAG: single-stranded-DNA-specific exonuclease RecJ [Pseudomonadota bacterium]
MEWRYNRTDPQEAARLAGEIKVSRLLAGMLIRRGAGDADAALEFLEPSLKRLPNPFLLTDMDRAVDRLIAAVGRREHITVYGDYDADGLTSTALLYGFLESIGSLASHYIPHRLDEGYGLNPGAVERLAAAGTKIIVTVDCGTSDWEAVEKARQLGVDVIVTDHHQIPRRLPRALAVINPQRQDCRFPGSGLAGVGVAFFLAGGLRQALRERGLLSRTDQPELAPLLGLVAIGTVADVAPLTGVNRILVSQGLVQLARPDRPGLEALKEAGAIEPGRPVTAREVAFRLAPRLNAAGRLKSSAPCLDLLLTRDLARARLLAAELEELNRERRRLQQKTVEEALLLMEEKVGAEFKSIVLAREGWLKGVVGLAASRLAEKYHRPVLLLALEDGLAKGSGRSIEGFNIFRALEECRDLMVRFGGHEQAAGLTLESGNLPELERVFEEIARREIDEAGLTPYLKIEDRIGLNDVLNGLISDLGRLAPYGEGNPDPVFALHGLNIISAGVVGAGHLKITLAQDGRNLELIGFGLGRKLPEIGRRVRAAIQRHSSFFRGRTVQGWKLVDIERDPG